MPVNCKSMGENEIMMILSAVLSRFPIKEIRFGFPGWVEALPGGDSLKMKIHRAIREAVSDISRLCDANGLSERLKECDFVKNAFLCESRPGEGVVNMEITMADGLFYDTLSANTGLNIYDDKSLVKVLGELSAAKKEYDKISYALSEVERKGYGIVFPSIDELTLEEPEIIKQGNKFGVRLKASAPSFHMICNKPKFLKTA